MQTLENFFRSISDIIWGNWLLVALVGIGILFTILTRFIQFRMLPYIIKETIIKPFTKSKKSIKGVGTLTPIQALCTAIASCVGSGNIIGVATAIISGGPGAIFWMWVAAIVGMATKYAEILIGILYREKNEKGEYVGGPMYYIAKGLKLPKLAIVYSILMVIQIIGGNFIQSNAVAGVLDSMFFIPPYVSAVLIFIAVSVVVIGGIKRLGLVTEKIVPLMALLYIVGGLIVILFNIRSLPNVFVLIFKSAFNVQAGVAGAVGYTIRETMRYGISRGLYSNEAGEGSAPVLHSSAITDHPARQALYGIMEVFVDTIIVCSITAFVILITGVYKSDNSAAVMSSMAFGSVHPLLKYIVGISLVLFAYTTLITQWYFGDVGLSYIIGPKKASYFKYIFPFFVIIGSLSSTKLVWYIQDCALGLLVIPNLIALLILSPDVYRLTKEFLDPKNGYINKGEK